MIAIPKHPQRRKRPDPPWQIDAHARIFAKLDQTFGQPFSQRPTLEIARHDPFIANDSQTVPGSLPASLERKVDSTSVQNYSLYLNFEGNRSRPSALNELGSRGIFPEIAIGQFADSR